MLNINQDLFCSLASSLNFTSFNVEELNYFLILNKDTFQAKFQPTKQTDRGLDCEKQALIICILVEKVISFMGGSSPNYVHIDLFD